MTNSERSTSTADIPRGSTPLPAPVLAAYKNLLDVCSANKVPLRTLFSAAEIDRLHEATLKIAAQEGTIKRQSSIIRDLEKQLGIDDL